MKNPCKQILYALRRARNSCDRFIKPVVKSESFRGTRSLLLILMRSTQTCLGSRITGHPVEYHKKTLTTTLRFLSAESLILHQSEFWFMDNQVLSTVQTFENILVVVQFHHCFNLTSIITHFNIPSKTRERKPELRELNLMTTYFMILPVIKTPL